LTYWYMRTRPPMSDGPQFDYLVVRAGRSDPAHTPRPCRRGETARVHGGLWCRSILLPCLRSAISASSTWSRRPCNLSTTRSGQGCRPCLRYNLSPMGRGPENKPSLTHSFAPLRSVAHQGPKPWVRLSQAKLLADAEWRLSDAEGSSA